MSPAAIFIECDIADIMQAVFDAPVAAIEIQELFRACFLGREARNAIGDLARRVSPEAPGYAFDSSDLFVMWKVEIVLKVGRSPNPAYFPTTVAFLHRFVLRGEKPPTSRLLCPPSGFAGCL